MKDGEPIQNYHLRRSLQTGIEFQPVVQGIAPELEVREAASFSGYSWKDWQTLSYDDQVDCVAYLRVRRFLDLIRSEVEAAAYEKDARQSRAR